MRVTNTIWVFNEATAAALEYLAREKNDLSMNTTAWFIKKFRRWWSLLMSTNGIALSYKSIAKFEEAHNDLMEFIDIVRGIYVKGGWKPWQRGVLVATTGILSISVELLDSGFDFVLCKRFSSNVIENLFSVIRTRFKVPTALEWRNALKSIILSQYAKTVRTSNYELDLSEKFATDGFGTELDFLRGTASKCSLTAPEWPQDWASKAPPSLSAKNQNALFCVAGYILDNIMTNQKVCEGCFDGVIVPRYREEYTLYIASREFEEGLLTFVSPEVFKWFVAVEGLFQAASACQGSTLDSKVLTSRIKESVQLHPFPTCHSLEEKTLSRFVLFRVKIHCAHATREIGSKKNNPRSKGSATAGGHEFALGSVVRP
ncbi:uncharacterized protein LOC135934700 [Cloeon dipterum]|uniref:uncharacterized protein LOC135934700 n=1 Tax=Cloeon dipterum TaxID=197152 RepID=UPI00321FE217